MAVLFKALRQYAHVGVAENDQIAVAASLWVNTHTLYYRAAPQPVESSEESPAASSKPASAKADRRERRPKLDEKLWIGGFIIFLTASSDGRRSLSDLNDWRISAVIWNPCISFGNCINRVLQNLAFNFVGLFA